MAEQGEFISSGKSCQFTYYSAFSFQSAEEIRSSQAETIPHIRAKHTKELQALCMFYSNIIAKYCEDKKAIAIKSGMTQFSILLTDIIVITLGRHYERYHPMIRFLYDITDSYDAETMFNIYDLHLAISLIKPYIDVMTGLGFTTSRTNHLALPGCYCAVTISWYRSH